MPQILILNLMSKAEQQWSALQVTEYCHKMKKNIK